MAKQSLLVADADPRSLRILDVALRKAGFNVATASDGNEALRRIQRDPPDLILADASLPGTDGVLLCRTVRADARLASTPVILISSSKEAALKLSAHEAGADDFLGKPLLIKELTTRIRMLLTRREQQKLQRGSQGTLAGDIGEMGLVDLIQSLDANGRSAVISCEDHDRTAQIWVCDGQVIDSEAGALTGEAAFYRVLGWEGGKFSAQFAAVDREPRIGQGTQGLLAESVRRVDELGRLSEQLPLSSVLSVDFPALSRRLADLPDEVNGVIRLCDGQRTIAQVMERAPIDELSVLAVLQRLLGEKVLTKVEPIEAAKSKPSLLQWLGPDSVATPAPPIMGAHGFPQSGDPTPIAPLISDPPVAFSQRMLSPVDPQVTPVDPIRVFDTPADPVPAPQITKPAVSAPAPQIVAPPIAPAPRPAPAPSPLQLVPQPSAPPPVHTDMFPLPKTAKDPVPVVHYAPMRGVRRERLRREADEARSQVAEGKPVRLTHVVELPGWPSGSADPRRRISPAVGEAAKKFAPDLSMGKPEASEIQAPAQPEPLTLMPLPDDEPESPPELRETASIKIAEAPAAPVVDDRDQLVESATMQVEPLSKESLSGPAPADSWRHVPRSTEPDPSLAAPTSPGEAAALAAAALEPTPVLHEAVTSPGHPIAAAPATYDSPTNRGHRVDAIAAERPAPSPVQAVTTPTSTPQVSSASETDIADVIAAAEAERDKASAETAEAHPVVLKTVHATASPDDDFEAEMRAALGKSSNRWPILIGLAIVAVLALLYFLRPQPPTDKKDSPWLKDSAVVAPPVEVAKATVPTVTPPAIDAGLAAALDAGPAAAVDAGAVASTDAGAAPAPDKAAAVAVAPTNGAYAAALAAGESLLKRGKYRPAVVELKKANALNPDAVPALLELGDAYLESDQPRSALKPLERAARLDPKSSRAQLLLGTAWQSLGKNGDAVKAYQRYLEMDPSGEYARDVRSILANLQK